MKIYYFVPGPFPDPCPVALAGVSHAKEAHYKGDTGTLFWSERIRPSVLFSSLDKSVYGFKMLSDQVVGNEVRMDLDKIQEGF